MEMRVKTLIVHRLNPSRDDVYVWDERVRKYVIKPPVIISKGKAWKVGDKGE